MKKRPSGNFSKLRIQKFLLAGIFILAIAGCNHSKENVKNKATDQKTAVPSKEMPKAATDTTAPLTATKQELDRLIGKWQRTDGSYMIEIFSVRADGTLDAGYTNPKPINVEKSQWIYRKGNLYIRVILRDVNYPGSTYTLVYDKGSDFLSGNYYQAVEGMNYDVLFTRKQ